MINDTKVRPARLWGLRRTGGKVEVLLLNPLGGNYWEALVRPGRRVRPGEYLEFGDGLLRAHVLERTSSGGRKLAFEWEGDFAEVLERLGKCPPLYQRALQIRGATRRFTRGKKDRRRRPPRVCTSPQIWPRFNAKG